MLRVNAPSEFANAQLNGAWVIVLWQRDNYVQTPIVSGPEAGRQWQFLADHLCEPGREDATPRG